MFPLSCGNTGGVGRTKKASSGKARPSVCVLPNFHECYNNFIVNGLNPGVSEVCLVLTCDQAYFFQGKGRGREREGKNTPDTFILRVANRPHHK